MHEFELLEETSNWKSREVKYIAGKWDQISKNIPSFELSEFSEGDAKTVNQYYKTVIRLPLTNLENRIPVGIVSNTYTLAQHTKVAELCIKGIKKCGIDVNNVRCELGLTPYGEWMNFRIYFPDEYNFAASDANPLKLRLECFNSVDGSSRLTILFGWFRFICSNGMVIGKTIRELRDIHNRHMDLTKINTIILEAMQQVHSDKKMMLKWEKIKINSKSLAKWVDTTVSTKWGKIAAFRIFHICSSGYDAKYSDPFEAKDPSCKAMIRLAKVPGAPDKSRNIYDVAQTLSWLATNRSNSEERTQWQSEIPNLINSFPKTNA